MQYVVIWSTQPPTVACKNGSSVGIRKRCMHVFLPIWRPICLLGRCLAKKFLHRSSGESLLRVHCWLGSTGEPVKYLTIQGCQVLLAQQSIRIWNRQAGSGTAIELPSYLLMTSSMGALEGEIYLLLPQNLHCWKEEAWPNQQCTLNKLPPELRCRNFVDKHRLSMQISTWRAKKRIHSVYMFQLSFHFARHRCWLGSYLHILLFPNFLKRKLISPSHESFTSSSSSSSSPAISSQTLFFSSLVCVWVCGQRKKI